MLKGAVFWNQVAVNLLMLGTFVYFFLTSWKYTVEDTTNRLTRDAVTTSVLVRTTLSDASKILDVMSEALEDEEPLSPEKAHEVLRRTIGHFSVLNISETLGLLICLDESGHLIAQSGESRSPVMDLSERSYFLDLKNNPSRRFVLGQLRVARTTGRRVFHLAMPLRSSSGKFLGVIAMQVGEREFLRTLLPMLSSREERISVQTMDGRNIFLYPPPQIPPTLSNTLDSQLLQGQGKGAARWFQIPRGEGSADQSFYVGYCDDDLFSIRSTARVPEAEVVRLFLARNKITLSFALFGLVIVNILFVVLVRQSRNLNQALFESLVDHVTLIGNRRAMDQEFRRLARDVGRRGGAISLLFIDIDRFKSFNDNHGHETGDRILREIAAVISSCMKRPLDFCCRWGGEEFAAVLPQTDLADAMTVAENIRRELRGLVIRTKSGDLLQPPTLSIGIASTRVIHKTTLEWLLVEADKAMLRAKLAGRDCMVMAETPQESPPHLPRIEEPRISVPTNSTGCRDVRE